MILGKYTSFIPFFVLFEIIIEQGFRPFPTKLWESQIRNIEDSTSLFLINIRWIYKTLALWRIIQNLRK